MALNTSVVFVQSASPSAIRTFDIASSAESGGLRFVHTSNPRSESDTWGGRVQNMSMIHGTVAAVNLAMCAASQPRASCTYVH